MRIPLAYKYNILKGIIGEVRCSFLRIYTPTSYSAVSYYMHLHLLTSILMPCGVGAILRFELDSFGWDWISPNVNFNLKNPHLQQLKNLANYNIQI